jgi:beta-lactamase regulating signal transducer with metallopeptidase domain
MQTSLTSLMAASIAPTAVALLGATAVKATLILIMASVLALILRRSAAATRHLVWATALAGVLLLPALDVVLPGWYVSLPGAGIVHALGDRLAPQQAEQQIAFKVSTVAAPARSAAVRHEERTASGATANPDDAKAGNAQAKPIASSTGAIDATIHDVTVTDAPAHTSPATILLELWLAGVVLALLPLFLGATQLARISRRARDVESDALDDFAARLARSLGIRRVVRLVEGGTNATPMTWGTLHPVVLVPAGFDTWSVEHQRDVLLHELAHVARYDCLTQSFARVTCALYWFNPLAWVAARQLRIERERSCDDHVLLAGARASSYAEHLLTIARTLRAPGATPVAALAMARPSQLEGRLLALLDARRARGVMKTRTAGMMAAGAVVVAAVLATMQPWSARIAAASEPDKSLFLLGTNPQRVPPDTDSVRASTRRPDSTTQANRSTSASTASAASPSVLTIGAGSSLGAPGSASTAMGVGIGTGTGTGEGRGQSSSTSVGGGRDTSGSVLIGNVGTNALSPKTFSLAGCDIPPNSSSSAQVSTDDDDHMRAHIKRGPCQILFEAEGKVTYNDQFTDIASIANGGWVEISDKGGPIAHKLRIVAGNDGTLSRTWTVDGERQPYDAAAANWLAQTLVTLDRYTQFSNGARIAAIYKKSGVKGVLDETENTSGDYGKRQNLARLFKMAKLDEAQLGRVLDMVKTDVQSDYERSEILHSLVQEGVITPALQVKYIAAAGDISSSYERGRSLEALTSTGLLTTQSQIAVYGAAAKTISDYDKSQIMQSVMKKYGLSAETAPAFLDAAKTVSSDYDLRVLLTAALKQLPENAPASVLEGMLVTATSNIDSEYDLAEFLITVAKSGPLTDAQRTRLEQAAESVKSEYDYGRVMSALRRRKTTNSL